MSVVIHDETDVERAVNAMCRLRHIPDVTVRAGSNGDVITVAQLGRVLNSVQLERLVIEGVGLPQTAIPELNSPGLRWLNVADTNFSNSAIENLPMSIEYLDATRTLIDDDGLSAFVLKTNLKKLMLRQNAVSDSAIIDLSKTDAVVRGLRSIGRRSSQVCCLLAERFCWARGVRVEERRIRCSLIENRWLQPTLACWRSRSVANEIGVSFHRC